jgi:cytochrome P450
MVHDVTSQHDIYFKYPLSLGFYPLGEPSPRTAPLKHFGVGLFGVNSDAHRAHRRLLMPAFHRKRIEAYCDTMVTLTAAELDQWRLGETRDIAAAMRELTLRVAVRTLFGADVDAQIGRTVRRMLEVIDLMATPRPSPTPATTPTETLQQPCTIDGGPGMPSGVPSRPAFSLT